MRFRFKNLAKKLVGGSRKVGKTLLRGTGAVRTVLGTVDKYTGGMATKLLSADPRGRMALGALGASETAGGALSDPKGKGKDYLVKNATRAAVGRLKS